MDIRGLLSLVEKYNIVSFDIFDTLLKRDTFKPTDVFLLVEKLYEKQYNKSIPFKKKRVLAEKLAREKCKYSEVTLEEIYDELTISEKEVFKKLELQMESSLLHSNVDIEEVYEYCLQKGKMVYIISDMYLPRAFLEEILQREGFSGYRKLYLSCDYRRTKRSGELYKEFCKEEKIMPKDVLHIGDSRYADFLGARKAGLKAKHIQRRYNHSLYSSIPADTANIYERSLYAYINNRLPLLESRAEKLGYEVLGPILFAFCSWIHEQYLASRTPKSRLWFAARDMYLFAEAYRIIYGSDAEMEYIYVSRNSLRPVLTQVTGNITESGSVFPRGENTLEDILRKMGYSVESIEGKDEYDFHKKYDVRRLGEYPEMVKALSSHYIREKEAELSKSGMKYLVEHGLINNDVFLADVGWHGTTQYILNRIIQAVGGKGQIKGLYIGCMDGTNDKIGKGNYQAFAFTEEQESPFGKGILIFEALILAPHGSTKRYEIQSNKCVPILGEPDNVIPYLKRLQNGALKFVEEYNSSILSTILESDSNTATKAFCRLALTPKKEELISVGELDYEDFGMGKIASPESIGHYLVHPKLLYNDLKHSPWRIGFLYRLCKIRLPYAKIYSFVRRKQGKMT